MTINDPHLGHLGGEDLVEVEVEEDLVVEEVFARLETTVLAFVGKPILIILIVFGVSGGETKPSDFRLILA